LPLLLLDDDDLSPLELLDDLAGEPELLPRCSVLA